MARDLNDTLVFVKVAELGSFVAAARALRLPKTTVSRKVQELEARLGAQLLHRTTRKLGLTEAGNIYFDHCQRIARDLDEAESAVSQLQDGPRGYFSVRTNPDPKDRRTDRVGGEVGIGGLFLPGWGMHLADMSLVQGDLVRLVEQIGANRR